MPLNRVPSAARLLTATAAVAVLGGCATKGDLRDVQVELRALAARQDSLLIELRRETRSTQDTLRETTDQIVSFRGDISRQLRDISQALTRLEALTGENQRGISQVRDQLANMRRQPMIQPPAGGDDQVAPGGGLSTGGDAQELYNAAFGQYRGGNLSTARSAFRAFLDAHPSHALAPDAWYYLGDIHFQERRWPEALEAFQQVSTLFPTATRVPQAMYRAALVRIEQGDRNAARALLERVVNTYPGTDAALLARDKLREIG